jgi:hypothetical protein
MVYNMSFQNKYLQYKQKYLNLKSQSGGADPDIAADLERIRNNVRADVRLYIHNNAPDYTTAMDFLNRTYVEGMTMAEARQIINVHPVLVRNSVRNYLMDNGPNSDNVAFTERYLDAIIYGNITFEEAIIKLRRYIAFHDKGHYILPNYI